jgi:hypothetical protein
MEDQSRQDPNDEANAATQTYELQLIQPKPGDDERTLHWKASKYAVGLVDVSWKSHQWNLSRSNATKGTNQNVILICSALCCSSQLCGRRGNMVELPANLMLGPYWPILIFVTYPLILGITLATAIMSIPHQSIPVVAVWASLYTLLLLTLGCVACRNPGVLPRHLKPKYTHHRHNTTIHEEWIWNDQALTYRPRTAKYDSACACVLEDFDHTCPWTGTAIAKNNIVPFRGFVFLVFLMLLFDIVLLTIPTL